MTGCHKPFWSRSDISWTYDMIKQSQKDTCVFASCAAAVNHLAGRKVWTEQSLQEECRNQDIMQGEPRVGMIAHAPVRNSIDYAFNTKDNSPLTNQTVREWVEHEGKIVILSRPMLYSAQQNGWHMLTLVAWDSDHYIAWDTAGKMSVIYEDEIEQGIPYRNGFVLAPHPSHDAFVYWKLTDHDGQKGAQPGGQTDGDV